MELMNNNIAKLSGKISSDYRKYHSTLGEEFLIVDVDVERKSGEIDTLPVVVSEKLLDAEIKSAAYVSFEGQIRTFNKTDGSVETYLFAKDAEVSEEGTFVNEVKLKGYLCKKGKHRTTYSGRKVIDFILAVNRPFNKSDYLAILAWGKDSKYVFGKDISTKFEITGRFQSRKYFKKDADGNKQERLAYEISSSQVISISK